MLMLDEIKNPHFRDIIKDIIRMHGNPDKLMYANRVAYWSHALLRKKGIIQENVQQTFVDIILGAALIHNLFIDESQKDKFYQIFYAREALTDYLKEKELPNEYINALFQLIESQNGETFVIPELRPNSDTPQSTMSTAKFIVDNIDDYIFKTMSEDMQELFKVAIADDTNESAEN